MVVINTSKNLFLLLLTIYKNVTNVPRVKMSVTTNLAIYIHDIWYVHIFWFLGSSHPPIRVILDLSHFLILRHIDVALIVINIE